jgi:hypothetical protein
MRSLLTATVVAIALLPAPLFAQQEPTGQGRLREDLTGKHGPYRVDMWYTENAFIMNKVRGESFYFRPKNAGDAWLMSLQGEWAFARNFSVWGLVSYNVVSPTFGESKTGIGDSELAVKWATINKRTLVLSLVGGALIPTSDQRTVLAEDAWYGYIGPRLWLPFGPGHEFELQVDAPLFAPFEEEEEAFGELNVALAWTSDIALTLLVEGIFEFSLEGSRPNSWVAPGVQYQFLRGWMAGASITFPINGEFAEEEDYRLVFGLLKEFELPWEREE